MNFCADQIAKERDEMAASHFIGFPIIENQTRAYQQKMLYSRGFFLLVLLGVFQRDSQLAGTLTRLAKLVI